MQTAIHDVCGDDLTNKIICDLLSGTGVVGRSFESNVKAIISNDLEYYSYVLNRNYIGNCEALDVKPRLEMLSNLKPLKSFVTQEYGE